MKILVLEDDAVTAHILKTALSSVGQVEHVSSPAAAFELYRKAEEMGTPFSLICLDLELPEYDGLEFLSELRLTELEEGIAPQHTTKVFVITSHTDPETFFDVNSIGCDAFLSKPIDLSKLKVELARQGLVGE
jgi:two-component system, chemotaxis family, chemotaxis protein CheY